jgi:8-amino-7-oxononanoate synthase
MSDWIDEALAQRRAAGLVRVRRAVLAQAGGRVRLAGRWLVNFASNDYLALATDPRLARAAARAARRYGTGATASPLIVGWSKPMRALERALADWEQCPRALCFASGFAANLGVVTALAGRGDVIFSDELNHASLIDGCRLSRASVQIYRHADANHLADLLAQHAAGARRLLIVSDSVFSMDGDLAPVPALAELAQRYGAMLVLDEAHATGILGAQGSGLAELHRDSLSPLGERFVKVGTLSKALGSQGGYVCASKQVVRYLLNTARPYIYSTGLAPPVAAARPLRGGHRPLARGGGEPRPGAGAGQGIADSLAGAGLVSPGDGDADCADCRWLDAAGAAPVAPSGAGGAVGAGDSPAHRPSGHRALAGQLDRRPHASRCVGVGRGVGPPASPPLGADPVTWRLADPVKRPGACAAARMPRRHQ